MKTPGKLLAAGSLLAVLLAAVGYFGVLPHLWSPPPARDFTGITGDPERGAYMVRASGCVACHTDTRTDSGLFAGGPPLKTPFGTFHAPNITPHAEAGIGGWSLATFSRALVAGVGPDGRHYYPSFPYTHYTRLKTRDIADMKAYLDTVPAVASPAPAHDLAWPFSDRALLGGWKWLFFKPRVPEETPARSEAWRRGEYLVNGPAHCGACHTERNAFGARVAERFGGTLSGPGGHPVPGIDTGKNHIEGWTVEDIVLALQTGLKPDGDVMGGAMGEVVEEGTSHMTDEDLEAIAVYLLSLSEDEAD